MLVNFSSFRTHNITDSPSLQAVSHAIFCAQKGLSRLILTLPTTSHYLHNPRLLPSHRPFSSLIPTTHLPTTDYQATAMPYPSNNTLNIKEGLSENHTRYIAAILQSIKRVSADGTFTVRRAPTYCIPTEALTVPRSITTMPVDCSATRTETPARLLLPTYSSP